MARWSGKGFTPPDDRLQRLPAPALTIFEPAIGGEVRAHEHATLQARLGLTMPVGGVASYRDQAGDSAVSPAGVRAVMAAPSKSMYMIRPPLTYAIRVAAFDRGMVTSRLGELGARVQPAPDEPDVLRFADDNGIIVELRVASAG